MKANTNSGSSGGSFGIHLPAIHGAANEASEQGQRRYIRLSATRLASLFVAAIAAASGLSIKSFDLAGLVLLVSFLVAALMELALIRFQPERDWYAGRAIAESTKTLVWRFAVQGEPFGPDLSPLEAEALLAARIAEILRRGKDRIMVPSTYSVVTASMKELRAQPFGIRQRAYLTNRTQDQQNWYSTNAAKNERAATGWRFALLAGELFAVVAAALAFGREEPADFAGIIAAFVAGGAAWLAIKQHSQITSAYRVAATELALQACMLKDVVEGDWPNAVADAEEAISREHTMWLATRGVEAIPPIQGGEG